VVVHAAAPAAAGATLEAPEPVDEIREFHEGSYVSSSEGIWRFCEFPMTSRIPNVVRFDVHLEDRQMVYFRCVVTATLKEPNLYSL
jgi:hypothetical protein